MVDTLNLNLVPDDSEEEFIVDFGEVINVGGGGTSDFNELTNRPKYDGQTMTGDTDIPKVPTTTSDLENTSDYQTGTEVQTAISTAVAGKQDTLTAGNNITIENNVISATDTTYTAGDAIDITGTVISANIKPADYFTASETVVGTNSALTLNNTIEAKLNDIQLLGDTEQDGTPAPNNPVDVNVVTGEQTVRILGKNLFEVADETKSSNGIDWVKSNGVCHGTGTLTGETWSNLIKEYDVDLPSGTYTFSIASPVPSPLLVEFVTYDNDGVRINYQIAAGKTSQTREFPNGLKKIGVAIVHGTIGNTYDITISDIQIEYGSTVTDYEPYQSQSYTVDLGSIELCKIGNYQDKIYKSGDDWYLHKEVGEITLDGSENSWMSAAILGGDKYRFHVDVSDVKTTTSETELGLVISNKLVEITNTAQYAGTQGIRVRSNGSQQLMLYINATSTMDVNAFKTWLSSNNIVCYYALATPTDTQITDAVLVSQLNLLYGASSYDEQTNFIVTATDLPAILNVAVYRKSLEGTLGAINSITDKDTTYTAGANIQISSSNVISATDTTYSPFVGTDGVSSGSSGLVPAPATTDAGKFLKADGTWDTAGGGGPTVVQTTGSSQTDVMSQDATTKMIFIPLLANQTAIKIGSGGVFNNTAFSAISIGSSANIRAGESVVVGTSASVTQNSGGAVVIGANAKSGNGSNNYGSIALGWGAGGNITASGMMDIGSLNTSYGYNNTAYRLITGVHDGQGAHDAATVAQGNTLATSAPTTSTVGVLGQLYTDTTNMHTYQCTDITGGVYTWTQRW